MNEVSTRPAHLEDGHKNHDVSTISVTTQTAFAPERAEPPTCRRRSIPWIGGLLALAAIGLVGYLLVNPRSRSRLWELSSKGQELFSQLVRGSEESTPEVESGRDLAPMHAAARWNGLVELTSEQLHNIGLELASVRPQTEPIKLEINGITAYDPNTQIQIRPKFASLIDRVYVGLGQTVEAGDPVVDLFSAELAAAKSKYEKMMAQWEHDQKELERARKLFEMKPPAISDKEYLSWVNDEKLSRTEAKLAADELLVYGLTEKEIDNVPNEHGTQKAKMTIRSPGSGVVIKREVVQGNRYTENDVLLVIAPLDHFWVWGNVYPSDATRVAIGQEWVVRCPLIDRDIPSKIEWITSEIAQDTKTVRIRTQIANIGGRLKADMLVGGYVEIPPAPGRTVIPRLALVSTDGADFVYVVRDPIPQPSKDAATIATGGCLASSLKVDPHLRFERRTIRVAQEDHDQVIVSEGLQPGERIATRGSLILSQMYEDSVNTEPDAPF